METVCFSEMLVSAYESTRRHNPEEERRHLHRCENLKSHKEVTRFLPFLNKTLLSRHRAVCVCVFRSNFEPVVKFFRNLV
jgi:hypothetical protein